MKILSDDELNKLRKIPNVVIFEPGSRSDAYNMRNKTQEFPKDDPNMQKILAKLDVKFPKVFYEDLGQKIRKKIAGYEFEFLRLPAGTKVYKGTKYFYGKVDTTQSVIWCADIQLAAKYALMYGGGMMVYTITRDIDLLMITDSNINGILNNFRLDRESMGIIKYLYAPGMNIVDRMIDITRRKRRSGKARDIVLYPEVDASEYKGHNVRKTMVRFFWNKPELKVHDQLMKYGIDGTFFPINTSPFYGFVRDEELAISPKLLKIDKLDPLYWENWDLDLPHDFILNEDSTVNRGMRVVNYYKDKNENIPDKDISNVRIVTYNVHSFISNNLLNDRYVVYDRTRDLLKQCNADLIVLQEVPYWALEKLDRDWNNVGYSPNGRSPDTHQSEQLYIVTILCPPLLEDSIKYKTYETVVDNTYRNAIIIYTNTLGSIACVHYPIGSPLFDNMGSILEYGDFDTRHAENIAMRIKYTKEIMKFDPDLIVGDCNFQPIDPEYTNMIEQGFETSSIEPTNVHDVKVDYIFTRPQLGETKTYVIHYNESDHRPVIGDIFVSKKIGGSKGPNANINSFWIAFIIILVIILILMLVRVIYAYSSGSNQSGGFSKGTDNSAISKRSVS